MNCENHNTVYYEVTGIEHFLKDYGSKQIGMCRVIDHPRYGLEAYPATIFTNAPIPLIESELTKLLKH